VAGQIVVMVELSIASAMRIRAEKARAESLAFHQGPMFLMTYNESRPWLPPKKSGAWLISGVFPAASLASAATMPNGWKKERDARSNRLHGS
jgi:hypothetical protein